MVRVSAAIMLLLMISCQSFRESDLQGIWHAQWVIDGTDTVPADLRHVRLEIENGDFLYQIRAHEQLKGIVQLKQSTLTLIPGTGPIEIDTIKVQIMELSSQSLLLRMNHDGQERRMMFGKTEMTAEAQ
jgi:hypothetical protein